jgi:hypothetical protein
VDRILQFPTALLRRKIAGFSKGNVLIPAASAPSPINSTWWECSITARAANTGLRGPKMPATAPAR